MVKPTKANASAPMVGTPPNRRSGDEIVDLEMTDLQGDGDISEITYHDPEMFYH